MNRSTGTGFIGSGLALIVVGAILRFAVSARTKGFDFHAAGVIGIWVGVLAVVIGLLLVFVGGSRKSTVRDSVVQTPSGSERVEERDDHVI
jgi:uncharacterized membrane protein YedE/YeeE